VNQLKQSPLCMLLVLFLLVGTACSTSSLLTTSAVINTKNDYIVILRPDTVLNQLVAVSPAQGWKSSGEDNGYVGFAPDTYGDVNFILEGEISENPVCTDNSATSAHWVITSLDISRFKHPHQNKGDRFGQSQRANRWPWGRGWLLKSFPKASEDGVLFKKTIRNGTIVGGMSNENNNNGRKLPKTAWYQVEATLCADETITVKIDPGVRNGGRK
jgi:hypothetical protein